MTERRALRLAHRGDWRDAPENTLAAIGAALAVDGCDGVEFDGQRARDGVPVLLHDSSLRRVQGVHAAVGSLTAAELADHGIPTLAAVLAAAGQAFLDIELKCPATPAIVAVIEDGRGRPDGTIARAVVSSFHDATLRTLHERRPRWPLWLNAKRLSERQVRRAQRLGCAGIAAGWRSITPDLAALVAGSGMELAAWTVRRRATIARLERLGVVAICVEAAALTR
jgi:glycerophosphoryl diester phosphodiesterase